MRHPKSVHGFLITPVLVSEFVLKLSRWQLNHVKAQVRPTPELSLFNSCDSVVITQAAESKSTPFLVFLPPKASEIGLSGYRSSATRPLRPGLLFIGATGRMTGMLGIFLCLAFAADPASLPPALEPVNSPKLSGRFADGGYRVEESPSWANDGKTFAELAKLACLPDNAGALAKYSATGKGDYRVGFAQRAFDAFQRYSGPVNAQFPRCYTSRACQQFHDSIDAWQYRRRVEPPNRALTSQEFADFKAACHAMCKAQESWTRDQALHHLVIVADGRDLQPLLAMLRDEKANRPLIYLALARIADDRAVPALAKGLSSKDREKVLAAAAALEYIGSEKALEALRRKPTGEH